MQRLIQQQVPIEAITLEDPLEEPPNMWLSDSDDENPQGVEPNEIEPVPAGVIDPIPVGAAIRVETPDPAQMVNETLDSQNIERPHSPLTQDKKLQSTIRKILTHLSSDTKDISRESISQGSTIDILRHICRLIDIDASSVPTGRRNVKIPLVNAIIEKGRKVTCSI